MHTKGILNVTNTYPVFIKASTENENGYYFSTNLSNIKKKGFEKNKEYIDSFNLELNKFVEECYYKADDYYLGKQINSNAALIFYKGDYGISLYTLKTNNYLILLNFGKFKDNEDISEIPDIKNYNIHVKNYSQSDKVYKVINTYNSFVNFSDINELYPNKEVNKPFFDSFLKSIENIDLSLNKVERRIREQNFVKLEGVYTYFKYIVVDDLIIIVDYFNTHLQFIND